MEHIQHDPLTKVQVKQALYDYLYKHVQNQFQNRLDTLIVRNAVISNYSHKSFMYRGEYYSCDTTTPPRKWNRLHPQLKDQMDEYLKDIDTLNRKELPYVLGYINQVLNLSNNFGDYLKLFSECLHPPLQKLIDSCPCHTSGLKDEEIVQITQQNQVPISMIKQRMVTNLLI